MALILLYTEYAGPFNSPNDPGGRDNTGMYYALYLRTEYSWDTDTKAVVTSGPFEEEYTGGYQGADPPPANGGIATTDVVDTYLLDGKTRRVFSDGMGGVTYQDAVPSLRIAAVATDETAAGNDGTIAVTATGGNGAISLSIFRAGSSYSATGTAPLTFRGLAPGRYSVAAQDETTPSPQQHGADVVVKAYTAPKGGCTDPLATNYDPTATSDNGTCSYAPRWRSAWREMAVAVEPLPDVSPTPAYLDAVLRIGFQDGHPLAGIRPLGAPLTVRAVVYPSGSAVFNLGPYLRPALGAPDGSGGYRLDLNSPTATTDDLYVGYELRRPTGELLQSGYALNAAVPDEQLTDDELLSPFYALLIWPGGYQLPQARLRPVSAGRYGMLVVPDQGSLAATREIHLPCPPNPVPVAWLAPGGGFGYWVFQGKPQLGDTVGEGQQYQEAETGEQRYSQRGDTRRTMEASTGKFRSQFREGLRTLLRSPQVWYQPDVESGVWVPVSLKSGDFTAGRVGIERNEWILQFTEAASQMVQGQ